jgi:hypothetical protein
MTGGHHVETLEIEGLWIDDKGQLLPQNADSSSEDDISDLSTEEFATKPNSIARPHRKMLEIVTDSPGSMAFNGPRTRGVIGGVLGWEYLLGEMFASDHVTTGMDVRY